MIVLQVFLIWEMAILVTARSVHHVRKIYDGYEMHMYGNEESHTFLTVNGNHRGLHEYFNSSSFDSFADKEEICSFPLSQPRFLAAILLIWSLTVMNNLRSTFEHFYWLVVQLPTFENMEEAETPGEEEGSIIVLGLTTTVKLFLTFCVMVPRLVINLVLLWLGCRWLVATPSFADLLLNAVALEFVLMLKDLLYFVAMSKQHKQENQSTAIQVMGVSAEKTVFTHSGSFFLVLLCVSWVYVYMFHVQQVLPLYNWDVHAVCRTYLKLHTDV
jgi:hypothetical protein